MRLPPYPSRIPAWLLRLIPGKRRRETATTRYVVLDTETTGFDYEKDRILCIGALRLQQRRIDVSDCLEIYLRQEHYDRRSTEIHGILSREERNYLDEKSAMETFLAYLGSDTIVAHFARFDITMLNQALIRQGLPKITNRVLDTSVLYRKTIINSPLVKKKDRYTLDELADKFDISRKDRHTALGDALITAIAFLRIKSMLEKKGVRNL